MSARSSWFKTESDWRLEAAPIALAAPTQKADALPRQQGSTGCAPKGGEPPRAMPAIQLRSGRCGSIGITGRNRERSCQQAAALLRPIIARMWQRPGVLDHLGEVADVEVAAAVAAARLQRLALFGLRGLLLNSITSTFVVIPCNSLNDPICDGLLLLFSFAASAAGRPCDSSATAARAATRPIPSTRIMARLRSYRAAP